MFESKKRFLVAAALASAVGLMPALSVSAAPKVRAEAKKAGQTVAMKVTDEGFVPGKVTVKKGQPVTLSITRTTDATCATEITIDGTDINQKLPLNETVAVTFTPKRSGELKYGCAMDKMIGGVLVVQ